MLGAIKQGHTRVVVNTAEFLPGDFTRNADFSLPTERLKRAITGHAGREQSHFVDAGRLATALLGPIHRRQHVHARLRLSARRAAAVGGGDREGDRDERRGGGDEHAAFRYGRRAAVDPKAVEALVKPQAGLENDSLKLSQSFDETVERRMAFLTAYQNAAYARRYRDWVEKVRAAEAAKAPGQCGLSEAVARYLFKLMAYKDEYEVARLYTDTSFVERVKASFDGDRLRFEFHLAPPLARAHQSGDRRAEEDVVRAVDAEGLRRAHEVQIPARHAASIRSATPKSAAPSAS